MHHAKLKPNPQFTRGKKGPSRDHAMHHFHAIMQNLFHNTCFKPLGDDKSI